MNKRKAFVTIVVTAALAVLIITAVVVVNIGCSEILQTRLRNDFVGSYYMAVAGAEEMYAQMRSLSGQSIAWPQPQNVGNALTRAFVVNGDNVGNFTANANVVQFDPVTNRGIFGIVSTGTVNGRSTTLTVKYGYTATSTGPLPLSSVGPMDLKGRPRFFIIPPSRVFADGPLESAGPITTNSYVTVTPNTINQNQPGITAPSFWLYSRFDTTNFASSNGYANLIDTNNDGTITQAEMTAQSGSNPNAPAIFTANDVNGDGVINDADAFFHYYTAFYNNPANNPTGTNLGINPNESSHPNYYTDPSGTVTLGPSSVNPNTNLIFVNGDALIVYNDMQWWGSANNHTVVATGDITIIQPINGADDTLALVAFGDINTGGLNLLGGIQGNLYAYGHGDLNAIFGGSSNGSIFLDGNTNVDTTLPSNLCSRTFHRSATAWTPPLGFPNIRTVTVNFNMMAENAPPPAGYIPRWERD